MIKYIQPVKPNSAQGLVAEVYAQIKQDFGAVTEPFLIHSPLPKLLSGAWMVCREAGLVGIVPREIKEAIAVAVSQTNKCPYCVDTHTIMLNAMGHKEVAETISSGRYSHIPGIELQRIVEWSMATTAPKSLALRVPPFSQQQAPEIIGTAVFFHYINRMATVLLGDTLLPFNQRWLKSPLKQVSIRMFSKAIIKPKEAGSSLQFLPKADLPNDLRWAKPAPNIARAYACFSMAIEEAGEYALPQTVRSFIQEEIDDWRGETSELRLAWSEDAISRLDEPYQAAADLALLAALSPHKVDEKLVLDFKRHFPENEKLVGALSWASFIAARKIGTWLHMSFIPNHRKTQLE